MDGERRPRRSAAESREAIIEAALIEFGERGYDGTPTGAVAARAGIKQPYIYAIFTDKRELFLTCFAVLNERMLGRFREAVEGITDPEDRLRAMGDSYLVWLSEDPATRCHLQVFAAAGHEELRAEVRKGFEETFAAIGKISELPRPFVTRFFATGLFLNALWMLGIAEGLVDDLRLPRG